MSGTESAERAVSLFFRLKDSMHRFKSLDADKTFAVLGGLRELESRLQRPLTISEIARFSGLAVPNVSRVLRPLEQRGLTARVKRGRTVNVVITAAGYETLEKHRQNFIKKIAAALNALDENERELFLSCAEKMLDVLEKSDNNFLREKTDVQTV